MKRFIVIVLVLLLLTGGGAGALIMLGIVPNPFAPKAAQLSAAEKAASAMDKNKFQPPLSAYKWVKVDDLIIPVIINGQIVRRVFITARIEAAQPSAEAGIKASLSQYQDAVIQDLVPFFQDYYTTHTVVDPVIVKEKLRSHAKAVFGDKVGDVLLTNVFDQSSGREQ